MVMQLNGFDFAAPAPEQGHPVPKYQVRIRAEGKPDDVRNFVDASAGASWLAEAAAIPSGMCRWPTGGPVEKLTLRWALERYRREVTPTKKGAANEVRRIAQWQRHPLAKRLLVDLRPADFAGFRDERLAEGVGASTVRKDLALIQHLYNVARLDWGLEGAGNPAKDIRKPKLPRGRDRRLTAVEEARLLERYVERGNYVHAAIMRFDLETAMRRGELVSLRWENIDLDERVATLLDTKNGDRRDVPLSSTAVEVLRGLGPQERGPVFSVHPDNVTLRFREACKAKGITGLRFHDLRHEATTRLFERGLNAMEVAAITGHKSLQMLKRYTHLRAKDLARKLD